MTSLTRRRAWATLANPPRPQRRHLEPYDRGLLVGVLATLGLVCLANGLFLLWFFGSPTRVPGAINLGFAGTSALTAVALHLRRWRVA